jgi:hypothetical protein
VADHVPASSASSAIPLAYFNYTHANSSVDHIAEKFLNSLLGGFRLLSSLSPALLHPLRQSLSGGCAHSTAPLTSRPAVSSHALSGGAGRINSFEQSNGLADAVSFLF